MITVLHPWLLLGLALPLVLLVAAWLRGGPGVPIPADHVVSAVSWRHRLERLLVRLGDVLPGIALGLAIILLATPLKPAPPTRERLVSNIELCQDVSGSMLSPFGNGTRYDAAMAAIAEFTTARAGDACGLTIFGNEVMRWTPLTTDTAAIRAATPFLRPDRLPGPFGGTEIGKALAFCLDHLEDRGGDADRMVVLLSDGISYDLDAARTSELAARFRATGATLFMIYIGDGGPQDELYTIAGASGGRVFPASDAAGLRECFARIDRMRPAKLAPRAVRPIPDRQPWAVALLVAGSVLVITRLRWRWSPW